MGHQTITILHLHLAYRFQILVFINVFFFPFWCSGLNFLLFLLVIYHRQSCFNGTTTSVHSEYSIQLKTSRRVCHSLIFLNLIGFSVFCVSMISLSVCPVFPFLSEKTFSFPFCDLSLKDKF